MLQTSAFRGLSCSPLKFRGIDQMLRWSGFHFGAALSATDSDLPHRQDSSCLTDSKPEA